MPSMAIEDSVEPLVVNNMSDASLHAIKVQEVTFDARVNLILKSELANALSLELRVQETTLTADVTASSVSKPAWEATTILTPETIVRVSGHVRTLHQNGEINGGRAQLNGHSTASDPIYAIRVTDLSVIAVASPKLPSFRRDDRTSAGLEQRLDNRILDVRNAAAGAVFKLHSGMCQLIIEFLCSEGFHWIHTPRIISATITGDNEYFQLPYFGKDAWLAQSSQHHKQMALSMDLERVFEIGPVFRAEVKSRNSARHLTEFTVLDVGMAFRDDYHEVVQMIERMLLFVLRGLNERKQYCSLVEVVQRLYPSARPFQIGLDKQGNIPRMSFLEAKRILRDELGLASDDGQNFTDQEEAALGQHVRNAPHLGRTDIFTIDQYPAKMRQFNSRASCNGLSNTWDTILRGREICSGSDRVNTYQEVCDAMRMGVCGPPLDPEADKWQPYLTAFKTGMPRHGGCGLGVNRLLQSFLGLEDVREVTLFPRDLNRLAP